MTAPNLSNITASLERSLQNCSLNHTAGSGREDVGAGFGRTSSSDSPENFSVSDTTLDLHSDVSLPYHWEQCLDLKTGEIYYINWRTGMKVKDDPRLTAVEYGGGGGEDCSDEEEDNSSCESEESSSQSSPAAESSSSSSFSSAAAARGQLRKDQSVLVVAGCKSCFMYFMVPKQVEECPKCSGQLLHFDRSEAGSS